MSLPWLSRQLSENPSWKVHAKSTRPPWLPPLSFVLLLRSAPVPFRSHLPKARTALVSCPSLLDSYPSQGNDLSLWSWGNPVPQRTQKISQVSNRSTCSAEQMDSLRPARGSDNDNEMGKPGTGAAAAAKATCWILLNQQSPSVYQTLHTRLSSPLFLASLEQSHTVTNPR